jgi:hypothetical protein
MFQLSKQRILFNFVLPFTAKQLSEEILRWGNQPAASLKGSVFVKMFFKCRRCILKQKNLAQYIELD